jgi:transcriptional regulator with XRE-family HTH domain
MKTREREEARRLRREEGRSLKEIERLVGVARSTVSLWVHDIELTEEQHAALRLRNPAYNRQLRGWAANEQKGRTRRRAYQEEGRRLARQADAFFIAGCMLYWAEGWKDRNSLHFSNSDPEMVRFFVDFLRTFFDVPSERIRLRCYLFADHVERQRQIEFFWLNHLGLPPTSLVRSAVNCYSRYSKKKRTNKLPYGTVRVAVGDTRVLQTIYGSLQEFGDFEREEWLG